ncbi:hypothetical protein ACFLUJ_04025, partial [Chloroflexota bacterium]
MEQKRRGLWLQRSGIMREGTMRKRIVLLCVAVSLFLIGSLAGNLLTNITLANPVDSVSIPQTINYQGLLTDKGTGSPLEGTVNITFSLYELPSGGSSVWEEIHTGVNVSHGLFNVQLGSINPIDTSHLTGESYLGVKVGADAEMVPRQSLASVPYAFHAENANTLDGIDSTDFITITGDNMTGPLSVNATIESTSGGFKFPDGSVQTTAGGGVKQLIHDFVVTSGGNVTTGDVVSFVDGYVQRGFPPGNKIDFTSEYVFNPSSTSDASIIALSSTSFMVTYKTSSQYGAAVVGDITTSNITYGSEYVFNASVTNYLSVASLSSTKFVLAYSDQGNSYYGTAIIGDVSGDNITYGSEYVFKSADTSYISAATLSSTKFVVTYQDLDNFGYGAAIIGNVSGDNITYGSEYVFNSATTDWGSATALSSTKFAVAYRDIGNSFYGTAVVGDVSGDNITYGSEYVFNPGSTSDASITALSSTKFVVAYRDEGYLSYGIAIIGDVSGSTITYGSEYWFNSSASSFVSASTLSSVKFVVAYNDSGNSQYGTAVIGDVSGNIITYGSEYVFNSAATYYASAAALSSTKFAVAYRDSGNSNYGTTVVGDVIYPSLVGIAKGSGIAGETIPVIIDGVSDVHSGLTPGEVYYATPSGDL